MFRRQEPRLHNKLFHLIKFQNCNSSLHLAPDKRAIWTGTGSSPNRNCWSDLMLPACWNVQALSGTLEDLNKSTCSWCEEEKRDWFAQSLTENVQRYIADGRRWILRILRTACGIMIGTFVFSVERRDICFLCGEKGHWARNCPKKQQQYKADWTEAGMEEREEPATLEQRTRPWGTPHTSRGWMHHTNTNTYHRRKRFFFRKERCMFWKTMV